MTRQVSTSATGAPRLDWQAFRRLMPVAERWAYFDHAAVAPLTAPAQKVLADWAADVAANGDVYWPRWAQGLPQVRRTAAELIGADADEVALVRNTTEGVNLVAEGFPWQPGDNLVTLADEFPTNQYAWLNLASRGVETRRLPTTNGRYDLADLAALCDQRTRLISISWVNFAHGWRNDLDALAELAHSRGAYLFVDAIQGLGVLPLDVRRTPVDFLAADGHKWLLGPEGAGLFYLRREHLDLLRPLGVGWNSVVGSHDFSRIDFRLKPSAERYEGGTWNMGGLLAMGESLKLLAQLGTAACEERILHLTDQACERLGSVGAEIMSDRSGPRRSGIVSFTVPGRDPQELRAQAIKQGVVLSCRGGGLRISPHVYNDETDVDRLIAAITQ
ncbi:MAG: aminotransferase class V-fold PLP-dependent enzyme [Planctomycetes bacterium]|nr:aminotransferase class V-fold PLP-dependent enzyme [Planctomycetota bacterium]